jgi:hypothetical protein
MTQQQASRRVNFCKQAEEIEEVLQRAVAHALWVHKRLYQSIAVWKDGEVVIVPPEEIVIPPEFLNPDGSFAHNPRGSAPS